MTTRNALRRFLFLLGPIYRYSYNLLLNDPDQFTGLDYLRQLDKGL
jgi:hypothetical protein